MRKLQLFGLVGLVALALATVPVGAFTFEGGNNLGKLADWTSFYSPNATAPGATPEVVGAPNFANLGDWDQEVFSITDLYQPPPQTTPNHYYAGTPELLGLVYDLKIGSVTSTVVNGQTIVSIQEVSGGRYTSMGYTGGRLDLWVNPATDFNPSAGPTAWVNGSAAGGSLANPFTAGNYDTYPTVSDGAATPLLSGTLVPNGDGTIASGPYAGDPIVLSLTLNLATGTGATDQGFIDILYNPTGIQFVNQYDGGLAQISFFENFKFYPNSTLNPYETNDSPFDNPTTGGGETSTTWWDSQSEDPVTFAVVVPEPTTISLLGMALVGLGGGVLRRRRK